MIIKKILNLIQPPGATPASQQAAAPGQTAAAPGQQAATAYQQAAAGHMAAASQTALGQSSAASQTGNMTASMVASGAPAPTMAEAAQGKNGSIQNL